MSGETKYLANIQIYTACHRKCRNKSSLTPTGAIRGLLRLVGRNDCAALLVPSPHRAFMLLASMSTDLAGNTSPIHAEDDA